MKDKNKNKIEKVLRLPSWIKFPISKASEFEKILRLPTWIKFPISKASEFQRIQGLIKK